MIDKYDVSESSPPSPKVSAVTIQAVMWLIEFDGGAPTFDRWNEFEAWLAADPKHGRLYSLFERQWRSLIPSPKHLGSAAVERGCGSQRRHGMPRFWLSLLSPNIAMCVRSHRKTVWDVLEAGKDKALCVFTGADQLTNGDTFRRRETPLLAFPSDVQDFIQHCVSRSDWNRIDKNTKRAISTLGCKLDPIVQIVPFKPTSLVLGFECLVLGASGESFSDICNRCQAFDLGLLRICSAISAMKTVSWLQAEAMKCGSGEVGSLIFSIGLDPLMLDSPHFEKFLRFHYQGVVRNVLFEINETTTKRSFEKLKMLQTRFDLRYAADDLSGWNCETAAGLVDRVDLTKIDHHAFANVMARRAHDPREAICALREHKVVGKPLIVEGVHDSDHQVFLERNWDYEKYGPLHGQGYALNVDVTRNSEVFSLMDRNVTRNCLSHWDELRGCYSSRRM